MKRFSFCVLAVLLCAHVVAAQKVPVQEVMLDNGMRLLLVQRRGDPSIAVGWVALNAWGLNRLLRLRPGPGPTAVAARADVAPPVGAASIRS